MHNLPISVGGLALALLSLPGAGLPGAGLTIAIGMPGTGEMVIIGLVVLLIFGGRKLPELANAMGKSITQFKRGLKSDDSLEEGSKDDKDGS